MAKNLKEFIQCGRDPAYLKNGDIITEELAWEVVGQEGYADGCLDQEFEITQSHIVEDIIGGEGVYETIYRESPDHPWQYIGLCAAGKDKNLAPIHAKTTYVCSKYRAKNEVELQQHIRDAVEACREVHERGNIPIAPHLYWPRFLDDNDPQDRDYGIAAGLEALKRCDEMIVIIRQEGPEEEWISQGMQAEIAAAAKMGIEPQFIYIGKVSSGNPGEVDIVFLMDNGIPSQEMITGLTKYITDPNIRPLTDKVVVKAPTAVNYSISLTYYINSSDSGSVETIQSEVAKAVDDFVTWQQSKIGRDINSSELIKRVTAAGAKRVEIKSPVFQKIGGTSIAYCTSKNVTYGGVEDD